MKFRKVISEFASAVCLLSLWSCAADADMPSPQPSSDDGIEFTVETRDNTPDGVTTTQNIRNFKTTAVYRGQYTSHVLLDNVIVSRTGLNSWEYSPKVSWPEYPVNFFMVSPTDIKWSVEYWNMVASIESYENDGKTDLIVAADYNAVAHPGPVKVNFRHALSRVSISLRNNIPDEYELKVQFVYVAGVLMLGRYNWPVQSTTLQNDSNAGDPNVSGFWTPYGFNAYSDYRYIYFGDSDPNNEGITLPFSPEKYTPLDKDGIQFMLPHKIEKEHLANYGAWLGGNIYVVYQIKEKQNGQIIWPGENTPSDQIFIGDKSRAIATFHLHDATPGHQWLPGLDYSYRLTLNLPDQIAEKTSGQSEASSNASAESESSVKTSARKLYDIKKSPTQSIGDNEMEVIVSVY